MADNELPIDYKWGVSGRPIRVQGRAEGGHIHPTDHSDDIPAFLSPGVYVPTTDDPQVSGRILLQLAENTPEVAAEFTADTPDEYNTTLVRTLRALADEIERDAAA